MSFPSFFFFTLGIIGAGTGVLVFESMCLFLFFPFLFKDRKKLSLYFV